jgi:drug/metabolite transporter (DMT)-like permease
MAEKAEIHPDRLTLIAFFTVVLVLGMNFVAVKFSNKELPPFWGASLRFIIASILLFGIVRIRNLSLPTGRALMGAALYGLFGFAINFGLLYWALTVISAGMASVLLATIPLITMFLASWWVEKLSWRGIVGPSLSSRNRPDLRGTAQGDVSMVYMAAGLLAAASAAASGIVVKYFPRSHPISTNLVGMSLAAVVLLILSLVLGETRGLPTLTSTWLALGWLIFSSIVGFVLLVWVLSRWSASATSNIAVLTPLVAVVSASLLAGETPTGIFLGGTALVLVGVYVGALSSPRSASKTPSAAGNGTQGSATPEIEVPES